MASLSQKIHTYTYIYIYIYIYQPKAKENQIQTHLRNPNIHLACEHPIIHLKARQQTEHGNKHIMVNTKSYKVYIWT